MKTFKQLREQTNNRRIWNPLTWFGNGKKDDQSSAPAPAPTPAPAPETTDYSTMIYGKPGIEMNPPLYYDEGSPVYAWQRPDQFKSFSSAEFYKQTRVPTADFVRNVTSGEPFKVPEIVRGNSRAFLDRDGMPIIPQPYADPEADTGWKLQVYMKPQPTQGPIQPNRYGIPRNPKVAQEIAAYRSQQPPKITTGYRKPFNTFLGPYYDDLRRHFRTPEARKAAEDERLTRQEIRWKSYENVAKAREEREAQVKAREAQARELKKATSAQTRFSQMAAKRGADASRRAAEKEIARTTSDLQTSRILGKEIASKLRSRIQTTRDRSEALRQSQADLASARTAAAETAQRQQERDRARESTIASQTQSIQDLEATIADMKADASRLQDQLAQSGSDNDLLTKQLEFLHANVTNLEARLQRERGN